MDLGSFIIQNTDDLPEDLLKKIDDILLSSMKVNHVSLRTPITLYYGDITTLQVDAIINAANDKGLGCFIPEHTCLDNIIHRKAGPRLRMACKKIMDKDNDILVRDRVFYTPGYCLPSDYIIHALGPVYDDAYHDYSCNLLIKTYWRILNLAKKMRLKVIALPCISTGIYGFPKDPASTIAIATVRKWLKNNVGITIIFTVYSKEDYEDYKKKLHALPEVALARTTPFGVVTWK